MVRFQMSLVSGKNIDHEVIHAGSIVLAVIAQLCSEIFSGLAKDSTVPNALFQASSRNVSETFPLEVTMDWWAENNWIMTDIWSTAWLVDAVICLFKRNILGPVSCNPEIHPPVFYLMWVMINSARICSMTLWDRHDVFGAVTLMWILPALSFYMLYISYANLDKYKAWLDINNPNQIWWIRYLAQNGLALFAWWTFLKALEGFGVVLKYKAGAGEPLVSTIILTIILLCALTWFILQSFLLTKYMSYTFTVYALLIVSLGAIFTRSYRLHDFAANTVYCGFLMVLMTVLSITHLVSACLCKEKASKLPSSVMFETAFRSEAKNQQKPQN